MGQTKHTPNWKALEEETGTGDISHYIQDMNSDPPETIARIVYSNEAAANADLLAAAPDMKKALMAVYQDIELQNVKGGSDELNLMVQAAIAKAKSSS